MLTTEDMALAAFNDLRAQNKLQEAERTLHELLRQNPRASRALFELGLLRQQLGAHIDAVDFFQRAVAAEPDYVAARRHLSGSLQQLQLFEAASQQLESALKLEPSDPLVHHALGVNYQQLGNLDEARIAYTNAISLRDDLYDSHNNLGTVLAAQGEEEEAVRHFDAALRLNSKLHQAVYNRAIIKKHRKVDRELKRIESRFRAKSTDSAARALLGFSLGKAYDDIGNYPKAAYFFAAANQYQRSENPYDVAKDVEGFQKITAAFKAKPLGNVQASPTDSIAPIFIVGMPRSGSSLVEHILASHSQVVGGGELEVLDEAIRSVVPYFLSEVSGISSSQLDEIASIYLNEVSSLVSGEARFVTDKMPRNSEYLGFIRAIFPGSKIIHTVRNPMDTCLSCFQQRFISPKLAYSSHLDDLGRYYRAHQELMQMWDTRFPGWINEVSYEDLVSKPERTIRRLLGDLDLEFDDACLNHHLNTGHNVKTASVAQVRQPIHRRSVQKWKNYKDLLAPLKKYFE